VNLRLPPFNLPEPTALIDDWIDGTPVRQLGLWTRADLFHQASVGWGC
jgi:hypothetical protein